MSVWPDERTSHKLNKPRSVGPTNAQKSRGIAQTLIGATQVLMLQLAERRQHFLAVVRRRHSHPCLGDPAFGIH